MIDTLTGYEQVPYQIENMRTGKRRKERSPQKAKQKKKKRSKEWRILFRE